MMSSRAFPYRVQIQAVPEQVIMIDALTKEARGAGRAQAKRGFAFTLFGSTRVVTRRGAAFIDVLEQFIFSICSEEDAL